MSALLELDRVIVVSWNDFLLAHTFFGVLVRLIAVYAVYSLPVILVVWWFMAGQKQREYLLSGVLSGLVAWEVLGNLWQLVVQRSRPDELLPIKELLFRRPDNSFPSDHAAFLSGLAFFFYLRRSRKASGWLFLLAGSVGLARIATAVHYPSDIIVGFLDGFLAAVIVSVLHDWLTKHVWSRLLVIARTLKLA